MWIFSCLSSFVNWLSLPSPPPKRGFFSFVSLFIISFLGIRYIGQTRRKCTSSSTVLGQKGQNRFSFGVLGLMYLSFSVFRTLFESLNSVKDCLTISIYHWNTRSRPPLVLRFGTENPCIMVDSESKNNEKRSIPSIDNRATFYPWPSVKNVWNDVVKSEMTSCIQCALKRIKSILYKMNSDDVSMNDLHWNVHCNAYNVLDATCRPCTCNSI